MKKAIWAVTTVAIVALTHLGCSGVQELPNPDGGNVTDAGTTDAGTPDAGAIQGSWLSTGTNIAPLLYGPPGNYRQINATFSGSTYVVDSYNDAGADTHLDGTFRVTEANDGGIQTIYITQNHPYSAMAQGIFAVDTSVTPNLMTYELAQTQPAISGVTPPDANKGFGSTSNGAYGRANVQKYVRQ